MSCKIEHKKFKGVESPLGQELLNIYKDLDKAIEEYDKISSSEFIERFGDWVNTDISNRTNDTGEPLLIESIGVNDAKNYHFEDKVGDRIDLIVQEFAGFDSLNLSNEIKEITENISSYIFKKHIKENFDDITSIKRVNVSKEITDYINSKKEEYKDLINETEDQEDIDTLNETIDYLDLIEEHNSEFKIEVENFFNSKKLSINEDTLQEDIQAAQDEGLQGGDIQRNIEKNTKDNATANVKLLMSFLPRYEYIAENNTFEKAYGRALGDEMFLPMDVVHKELLESLADIVPIETVNSITDIYEHMVSEIKILSNKKPHYNDLLVLLEELSNDKKTEFMSAFYNYKVNYTTSIITPGNFAKYQVFNSTVQNDQAETYLTEWQATFKKSFVNKKTKGLHKEPLTEISNKLQKSIISLNKSRKGLDINNVTDVEFADIFQPRLEEMVEVFEDLGITNLTPEGINLFLNRLDSTVDETINASMFNKLRNTLIDTKDIVDKTIKANNYKVNIFKDYKSKLFGSLSKAEAFYKEDPADNTIMAGGKMYWTLSKPSYISNKINSFKTNPKVIEETQSHTINKNSNWASHLLGKDSTTEGDYLYDEAGRKLQSKKRLEKLSLNVFNSFQEKDKAAESSDNTEVSYLDQLGDEMNKVLIGGIKGKNGKKVGHSPIYSTSQAADKSTRHEITIDYFVEDTVKSTTGGKLTFSDKILNIFVNYFTDEVNRMREAFVELNTLDESDLKVHYHLDGKGNRLNSDGLLAGNAFQSQIFPEFSPTKEFIKSDFNIDNAFYDPITGEPLFVSTRGLSESQISAIKERINTILHDRIVTNYRELLEIGLVVPKLNEMGQKRLIVKAVDQKILAGYRSEYEVDLTASAVMNLISDFTLNSAIANVEYTKLFTGDPAYYKNMVDFFKRVPATYTDGLNLRLGLTEGDRTFTMSVIQNQVSGSKYLDEIKKGLDLTEINEADKKYVLESYEEVNQTDAQGWITPARWAFLVSRTGKWNNEYETTYAKMLGTNKEPFTAKELKYVAQPLKGVYFGIAHGVPTYIKYSQAVLIPSLIKGTELETLHNNMISSKTDEAVTLDGVKVGANQPNIITDSNGSITKTKLTTITLNNSDWKLQQDLPTKLIKDTVLGSQIQKNILNNIDISDDNIYTLEDGTQLSSIEILDKINSTLSALSNNAINQLSLELGKDSFDRIDVAKFYSTLESELIDKDYPINMVKSVQKNLPIDSIPGIKDKMYNILFSRIKKAAIKINTQGGSFIQISNFGLDKFTGDEMGVKWLVKPDALKPPILVKDLDGKTKVKPGQILISHSIIAKYLPNYQNMSIEEINSKIDKKLFRAIGYRIPNQAMSSNDALEIVGILPPGQGDSIVAYTEITTKTGSDFDIDKMYVMLPSFNVNYNTRTFKKARKYIIDNNITNQEIYTELEPLGYTKEMFKNTETTPREIFTEKVLMGGEGDSAYHLDFLNEIKEGDVESITYADTNSTTKGLQNQLFEAYWALLVNPNNYADLVTPIDFEHVKNAIKKLHGDNSKQTGELLKFYDPIYQLKLKKKYIGGKAGVGQTANHLVDHARSRNIGLKFSSYNLGVGHTNASNETIFDEEYSETLNGTRYKIAHTLSAFLNAYVDNAKDPYISDGNFTTYTSNVAFMLIRAGVHPDWIVSFMGQPVLKELVEFTDIYESKSIPKEKEWMSGYDIIVEKYSKDMDPKTISNIKKGIKGSTTWNFGKPETLPTDNNFLKLHTLFMFKEFQDQSKKLGLSVNLSRFDTVGAGKDQLDMLVYVNQLKDILSKEGRPGEITNHINKYVFNEKLTSLGTQLINTVEYSRKLLENNPTLFLLASDPVFKVFNDITNGMNNSGGGSKGNITDKELAKKLNDEIYSYIMSDFPKFKIEGSPLEYIEDTKNDILNYKLEQSELFVDEQNLFINSLQFFDESFGMFSKSMSKDVKDSYYRSFKDLMFEQPELADKIVVSLYLQNGFNRNLIDFREFIPHEWFIQNNIREFFRAKDKEFSSSIALESFKKQFFQTASEDNKIVSKVNKNVYLKLNDIKISDGFTLNLDSPNIKKYTLGFNSRRQLVFPNYLKINEEALYSLQGYVGESPIYKRINRLSYSSKKSHLNIREYKYNESVNESFNEDNNINSSDIVDKYIENNNVYFIDNYTFNDVQPNSINNVENILLSKLNVVPLPQDVLNSIEVHDKLDEDAYSISMNINNKTYSFGVSRNGEIIDAEYHNPNTSSDISDNNFSLSQSEVDSIFEHIESNDLNNNEESPLDCN